MKKSISVCSPVHVQTKSRRTTIAIATKKNRQRRREAVNLHPVEDVDCLDHVPHVGGRIFDTEQILSEHRHSLFDGEDDILKGPCRGTYV